MGWVFFQGGNPEFPVWTSGIGGGGGSVSDVVWVAPSEPGASMELWYDTDDEVPLDPRYTTPEYVNTNFFLVNTELDDLRNNTAWGIMAQFPRLGAVSINTQVAVTGNLNFTFQNGRRYRLVIYIRAVQVAAVQAGTMVLMNGAVSLTATYGGSVHYYVGPGYGTAYGEWIIDGTGQNHNALHIEAQCATATAHMTANSQAYIEDVGPVTRT